jgi:hypothetical protein
MTPEMAASILSKAKSMDAAAIFQGNTQHPFGVQSVTIALDAGNDKSSGNFGNPFKISFPFKSVYLQAATDTATYVNLAPDTQDTYQSGIPMKLNDCLVLNSPVSSAFLTWPAQAGKTVTLIFFVSAEFRTGSQLSVSGGGVSINDGSAFTMTNVSLTAGTAGQVFALNGLRKISTFQNNSGASVWVGLSTVTNSGATRGYEVPAGASFQWRNSAQLYAYSVAGGTNILALIEET